MNATDRFVTETAGYTTWHCFSSGAHYDPQRVSWGPVVALDEHLVAPGGGFDWHPHRGVHIASWVLEGTLRHEGSGGPSRLVRPGELFTQSTGDGIRHRETNASDSVPLRMVQLVVLGAGPVAVGSADLPAVLGDVIVDVVGGVTRVAGGLVFVTRGEHAGSLLVGGGQVDGEALVIRSNAMSENHR